jgi:hypothetical protein
VSADAKPWPEWIRRHTALELLGPPGVFFAKLTIALSLGAILYVGAWNAAKYPIVLGYDMQPNAAYAHILLDQHHIPHPDQSAEAHQPPGYYFVAEVAARAGHEIFGWLEARPFSAQLPEASYRGAQILNVALVLGTALILLALARLVAPGRPEVWAASVAFFAFLPVVSKTAAMFHPETLNMFLSAAAILVATRMMRARRLTVRPLALLVLCLLGGFLTRSSTLFTLIAIVIGMVVVFGSSRARVQLSSRNKIATLAALVVVAGIGLMLVNRAPDLASGLHFGARTSVATRSNFLRFDLLSMFRAPYRPNLVNEAFPVTYMEIWGDWIGAFAWNPFSSAPTQKALAVLKDQVWIGVLPTLLALAGWLALAQRAIRRRPELAALAALPLVAVAGYLLRSYQLMSADGDLLKASYLLTTAPVWALGFGSAFVAVGRYRRVQLVLGACLVVFAVLELRFTMYGVRDSLPIF